MAQIRAAAPTIPDAIPSELEIDEALGTKAVIASASDCASRFDCYV